MSKFNFLGAISFVSLLLLSTTSVAVQVNLPDFTELVEENAPSVVKISTVAEAKTAKSGRTEEVPELFRYFFGDQLPDDFQYNQPQPSQGLGSGFIMSADG